MNIKEYSMKIMKYTLWAMLVCRCYLLLVKAYWI